MTVKTGEQEQVFFKALLSPRYCWGEKSNGLTWGFRIEKQQTFLKNEHASDWEWAGEMKAGESLWALQWDHLCDAESHLTGIDAWISFCAPLKRIPSGQGSFSEPSHIKRGWRNQGRTQDILVPPKVTVLFLNRPGFTGFWGLFVTQSMCADAMIAELLHTYGMLEKLQSWSWPVHSQRWWPPCLWQDKALDPVDFLFVHRIQRCCSLHIEGLGVIVRMPPGREYGMDSVLMDPGHLKGNY